MALRTAVRTLVPRDSAARGGCPESASGPVGWLLVRRCRELRLVEVPVRALQLNTEDGPFRFRIIDFIRLTSVTIFPDCLSAKLGSIRH